MILLYHVISRLSPSWNSFKLCKHHFSHPDMEVASVCRVNYVKAYKMAGLGELLLLDRAAPSTGPCPRSINWSELLFWCRQDETLWVQNQIIWAIFTHPNGQLLPSSMSKLTTLWPLGNLPECTKRILIPGIRTRKASADTWVLYLNHTILYSAYLMLTPVHLKTVLIYSFLFVVVVRLFCGTVTTFKTWNLG